MGQKLLERDWIYLLESILKINYASTVSSMQKIVLERVGVQIPYTKAVFFLARRTQKNIYSSHPAAVNIPEQNLERFIKGRYDDDEYFRCLYYDTKPTVFRDTDMMTKELRENTCIFRDIYSKENIYYAVRSVFIYDDTLLGYMALFRPEQQSDFSNLEIEILRLMVEHISYKLYSLLKNELLTESGGEPELLGYYIKRYDMTIREAEVTELLKTGYTNNEICDKLFISPSTLRKHLNKIFSKAAVKNLQELLQKI